MKIFCSSVLSVYILSGTAFAVTMDEAQQRVNAARSKKERYAAAVVMGVAQTDARQYQRAIETYQEAVALYPKKEDAHMGLARVYEQSELFELSRQEYITILRYFRRSDDAEAGLARLYLRQGLVTQAMEHFRRALSLRPTTDRYRDMARCAESSGDIVLAIGLLQQALFREERYDDLLRLGRFHEENKNQAMAEKTLSRAIQVDPARVEGYIALSLLYLRSNNLPPALNLLKIAQEKAPDEGLIRFFIAVIYAQQGKPAAALGQASTAVRLSKTDMLSSYARKLEQRLKEGSVR